jgi:hypothetical protein
VTASLVALSSPAPAMTRQHDVTARGEGKRVTESELWREALAAAAGLARRRHPKDGLAAALARLGRAFMARNA